MRLAFGILDLSARLVLALGIGCLLLAAWLAWNTLSFARSALPAAFKEDIKRFHLALPKAHPDIYRRIERGGGTGYREVTHQTFELIVALRREEASARPRRS